MSVRVSYRLSFPRLHSHLVDVSAWFQDVAHTDEPISVKMAAWTPGSYLVRDYARQVQDLSAADERGCLLEVSKIDKATWRIVPAGGRDLVLRYAVYAWDLTVRTNHVDDTHAFLNGAATYLWLDGRRDEPVEVQVEAPAGWRVVTALDGDPDRFSAQNLDELIDAPIHVGPGPVLDLSAAGRPAQMAVWGRPDGGGMAAGTLERLVADAQAIMGAHAAVFGGVPYDRYVFILMLAPGGLGGLEHARSAALLASPFAFGSRKKYEELLELVSHEYFHLWNVKRIRPAALDRFDYARENYTRALWLMEGVTSYYDRYTVRRAGLMPTKRFLEKLGEEWGKLQATPGRTKQSLEESSFDAWIKLYRPDENSVNSTISYYLKGGLVALCLDLEIRKRTAGSRSLDDVMRHLWAKSEGGKRSFDEQRLCTELSEAVGLDLDAFFERHVRGRGDPDLASALAAVGLELKASWDKWPPEGIGQDVPPAWLGANVRSQEGGLVVAQVLSGSPAERAGVAPGDEIVALDGFRTAEEKSLGDRILARKPGERIRTTVFRRDELRDIDIVLGERPRDKFEIVPVDQPGDAERSLYQSWLGEPHPRPP